MGSSAYLVDGALEDNVEGSSDLAVRDHLWGKGAVVSTCMQGTVEGRSELAVRDHLLACLEVHLDEGVRNLVESRLRTVNQWQSMAINGNQWQSVAISGNLVESRLLEPLEDADGLEGAAYGIARIHRVGDRDLAVQLMREAIRGHHRSSEVIEISRYT
jgi:hypothetical protein